MTNTHIEHVKREFTNDELLAFGKLSAQMFEKIRQLEEEKKQSADYFKGEITQCETSISDLLLKIARGYEVLETPCDIMFDQPVKGMKQYICQKTRNVVKTVPMTDADRPGPLFAGE